MFLCLDYQVCPTQHILSTGRTDPIRTSACGSVSGSPPRSLSLTNFSVRAPGIRRDSSHIKFCVVLIFLSLGYGGMAVTAPWLLNKIILLWVKMKIFIKIHIFILSAAKITVKGNNVRNIKLTRSHGVTFLFLIAMVLDRPLTSKRFVNSQHVFILGISI